MSARLLALLALVALLFSSVPAQAATSVTGGATESGSACIPTRFTAAVATILAAGQLDACLYFSADEHSSSSVGVVAFDASGPTTIGANTVTYSMATTSATGCTVSAWTQSSDNTAASTGGQGYATVTMTSRDCRIVTQLTVTATTVGAFAKPFFAMNIHVADNYVLDYECASPATTPDAFNPASNTCTAPPDPLPVGPYEEAGAQIYQSASGAYFTAPPSILEITKGATTSGALGIPFNFGISVPAALGATVGYAQSVSSLTLSATTCQGLATLTDNTPETDPRMTHFSGVYQYAVTPSGSSGEGIYCLVDFELGWQVAGVTQEVRHFSVLVRSAPTTDQRTYLCGTTLTGLGSATCSTPTVSAAVTGTLDTQARLCAASALGTSCTTPTINVGLSGTITANVAQSGSWTMTNNVAQSGTWTITDDANGWAVAQASGTAWKLDSQDRLCAASTTGAACTTPLINIGQSGTWSMTNTLNGGITITDDANGWAIHQDPISGALTLSGEVNPCSTASLAGDANACRLDTTASTVTIGNNTNTVNVTLPDKMHLCGAPVAGNASACQPVNSASVVSSPLANYWVPVLVFGAIFLLMFWRLMATGIQWLFGFVLAILALGAVIIPGFNVLGTQAGLPMAMAGVIIVAFVNRFGWESTRERRAKKYASG